jgi:hypothetical protein
MAVWAFTLVCHGLHNQEPGVNSLKRGMECDIPRPHPSLGEDHATGDGGHKHGTTEFGVATQATKRKTEDGGEAELLRSGNMSNNSYSSYRREILTDSKLRMRIIMATEAVPWVVMAAIENITQRTRYTVSIYRGLNAFIIISPLAMKRIAAYRPCATASKSAE